MPERPIADDTRCSFTPEELAAMRRKFDEDCDRLGVSYEDDRARAAVGRAVVRSFERGQAEPMPPRP